MKPIQIHFNFFKKKLEAIKPITIGKVLMDVSQLQVPSPPDPDIQEIDSLVTGNDDLFSTFQERHLDNIRSEAESNLSMPILKKIKIEYLTEILDFYSALEVRIYENEKGDAVTDIFKFDKRLEFDNLNEFHKDMFMGFIRHFKEDLRDEILFFSNELRRLKNQYNKKSGSKMSKPDIEWKTDLNDLIELVRALKISKAINNKSENISFKDVYKIFGDLFGVEIKNPEDQIRQKSQTQDKESFCEKLSRISKDDIMDFYIRSSK